MFRLALAFGIPVGELEKRISAQEFIEWAAFYRLEPWGEARADLRSGVVASLIYNVNRARDSESLSPADFMLFQDRDESETPPAETPPDANALRARFMTLFSPRT